MRYTGSLIVLLLPWLLFGCTGQENSARFIDRLTKEFNSGNFQVVTSLADSVRLVKNADSRLVNKADSLSQIARRITLDFALNEAIFSEQLREKIGDYREDNVDLWEGRRWLEWRMIDGEKKYFNRAASNLILLSNFYLDRSGRDSSIARDPEIIFRKNHTSGILAESATRPGPVLPVGMNITYTLTVDPDVVPPGEKVRCWLPYPSGLHPRQGNIRFLSASEENPVLAPDSAVHRTVYMETQAEKGKPVSFSVSFSYESSGQFLDPARLVLKPYDKNSRLYVENTSEQLPHICFTENVKRLADSIAGGDEDPFSTVRKIWLWFSENIPWTGALEYSIIPCIPEYTLTNRRGDCGQQTFLFMSMLRYRGIPVRWQSGWMVPPEGKNLHDWCEVYFEGTGWVPVDVSYGCQYSNDPRLKEFFLSGIDSYRLIINNGVAGELFPPKKYLRSEPYDFQRGEVEWEGGNLYFDKWDYNMEITYK